jgi:hypothetical protein
MTRTLAATTMNDLRTAAQQALEALKDCVKALDALHAPGDSIYTRASDLADRAEIALRAVLAQPEQEVKGCDHCNHPLFAAIKCRVCGLVTEQEPVAWTDRELQLIDGMIEVQLHHAAQCDGIANRTMAEKQKGWDMERVALLHKIKSISPRCETEQEPGVCGRCGGLVYDPVVAQQEQEPVLVVEQEPDYMSRGHFYEGSKPFIDPTEVWKLPIGTKLYTHPPRRKWRSLSEDELTALGVIHSRYQEESLETGGWFDFARAVEAALKERNNG